MSKIEGVNEMVDRTDIGYVANALGIPLTKRGSTYFCLCPLPDHQDTHATNCFFREGDNYLYCMVCRKNIDAIDLIRYTKKISFMEAVKELWELSGCPDYVKLQGKKTKKASLPLDGPTLRFLGITLPAYIPVPVGIDTYNRNALPENRRKKEKVMYMKTLGYVRCERKKVRWIDFISEESLAYLLLTKAKEQAEAAQACLASLSDPYLKKSVEKDWKTAMSIIAQCQKYLRSI